MAEPTPAELYQRAALETLAQVREKVEARRDAAGREDLLAYYGAYVSVLSDIYELERSLGT